MMTPYSLDMTLSSVTFHLKIHHSSLHMRKMSCRPKFRNNLQKILFSATQNYQHYQGRENPESLEVPKKTQR